MKWAHQNQISKIQEEILSVFPATVARTQCDGGCKYGTGPFGCFADCECPKQITNPRISQLKMELFSLQQMLFCSCKMQVLPEFKFCPFCSAQQPPRDHSNCQNRNKFHPFCSDCGYPN